MRSEKKDQSFILRWKNSEIVKLGVILILSSIGSIFFLDQPITIWLHDSFNGALDHVAKVFTWFGQGDLYFFISVVGYLVARLFLARLSHLSWPKRLAEARGYFIFMFLSFAISGVIVITLKAIFGRCRPYFSPDFLPINFKPFTLNWDYQSYPSGHTQVGFTLASFLSILYPKGTRIYFAFASLIGISRIVLEKHYLGDVLAGAYVGILGVFIAWSWKGNSLLLVQQSHKQKEFNSKKSL